MLKLFFPILITILSSILLGKQSCAQKPKPQNQPKFDRALIHYGFLIGMNHADFIVSPNDFDPTVYVVEAEGDNGFTLGIVSNLRLGLNCDLRFIPALSFSQRSLEYTMLDNNKLVTRIKKIESTFLEFPFTLKYKSMRINNGRAFVLGGLRYSIDLASQKNVEKEDDDLVKLKSNDLSYEVGFGLDFYMKYFKLSPVIGLAIGTNDILIKEQGNIFSETIDRLKSKIVQVAITFE